MIILKIFMFILEKNLVQKQFWDVQEEKQYASNLSDLFPQVAEVPSDRLHLWLLLWREQKTFLCMVLFWLNSCYISSDGFTQKLNSYSGKLWKRLLTLVPPTVERYWLEIVIHKTTADLYLLIKCVRWAVTQRCVTRPWAIKASNSWPCYCIYGRLVWIQ